jgi:hypothetical protein
MEAAKLSHAVARIHAGIMALVFAILCGGGLFVMTAWLLIKGGEEVGLHLQLLGQYFLGYSVSWMGSFVGLAYGAGVGGIVGWMIGMLYNRIVGIRQR